MRFIGTIDKEDQGLKFSAFLSKHNIANQCERVSNQDWGSEKYGSTGCKIWITDEDQVDEAQNWLDLFLNHPEDSRFDIAIATSQKAYQQAPFTPYVVAEKKKIDSSQKVSFRKSTGTITFFLLIICGWIFLWGKLTAPHVESYPNFLPPTALLSPAINKELLFDYPESYTLASRLLSLYTPEELTSLDSLPVEGQALLIKFFNTPHWQGFYPKIVEFFKTKDAESLSVKEPLFEKIRQGEVWRLFSPALLHQDIFHLLFNMFWLVILGKQMELRLGPGRYLGFLFAAAFFSNLCQYFMSGPNFLGFSGVVCAMITFIWMRQKYAPWEGYDLQRSTFGVIILFILFMASLQVFSFVASILGTEISMPSIANTAHLSGAFIGLVLGRLPVFSWDRQ